MVTEARVRESRLASVIIIIIIIIVIIYPQDHHHLLWPHRHPHQALAQFSEGRTNILMATAVLARGLDIPEVIFLLTLHQRKYEIVH